MDQETMAAEIFMRMISMSHSDLCIRMGHADYFHHLGPSPAEVAEYARMAAAVFYSRKVEQASDDVDVG